MRIVVLVVSFLVVGSVTLAKADSDCLAAYKDIPIDSTLATASSWSNIRNAEGSLRYESNRIITGSGEGIAGAAQPDSFCPAGCKPDSNPIVVFKSVPNKYLQDYEDAPKCEKYLAETLNSPITYDNKKFASLEELSSWFSDFSQGSRAEGKDLYKKCDGDCSPQYTSFMEKITGGYRLSAKVVCGKARDKNDNQYKLSAAYRWRCQTAN